jgi:hypothetical protein
LVVPLRIDELLHLAIVLAEQLGDKFKDVLILLVAESARTPDYPYIG